MREWQARPYQRLDCGRREVLIDPFVVVGSLGLHQCSANENGIDTRDNLRLFVFDVPKFGMGDSTRLNQGITHEREFDHGGSSESETSPTSGATRRCVPPNTLVNLDKLSLMVNSTFCLVFVYQTNNNFPHSADYNEKLRA